MNRKPKFLIDCDGVLAHFTKPVLNFINHTTGSAFEDRDITEWDTYKALGIPKEVGDACDNFIKSKGFCANLEAYPGTVTWFNKLREFADVRIVTAPFDSDYWARERELWLGRHFGVDRHHIVQTHSKEDVCGDVLVDDKTSTLLKWGDAQDGIPVLFSQPWNIADAFEIGPRVNDWAQLVAFLRMKFA